MMNDRNYGDGGLKPGQKEIRRKENRRKGNERERLRWELGHSGKMRWK